MHIFFKLYLFWKYSRNRIKENARGMENILSYAVFSLMRFLSYSVSPVFGIRFSLLCGFGQFRSFVPQFITFANTVARNIPLSSVRIDKTFSTKKQDLSCHLSLTVINCVLIQSQNRTTLLHFMGAFSLIRFLS